MVLREKMFKIFVLQRAQVRSHLPFWCMPTMPEKELSKVSLWLKERRKTLPLD
jgi:hypothetical protein